MGMPQNGWFVLGNPINMDDYKGTSSPILGNLDPSLHGLRASNSTPVQVLALRSSPTRRSQRGHTWSSRSVVLARQVTRLFFSLKMKGVWKPVGKNPPRL